MLVSLSPKSIGVQSFQAPKNVPAQPSLRIQPDQVSFQRTVIPQETFSFDEVKNLTAKMVTLIDQKNFTKESVETLLNSPEISAKTKTVLPVSDFVKEEALHDAVAASMITELEPPDNLKRSINIDFTKNPVYAMMHICHELTHVIQLTNPEYKNPVLKAFQSDRSAALDATFHNINHCIKDNLTNEKGRYYSLYQQYRQTQNDPAANAKIAKKLKPMMDFIFKEVYKQMDVKKDQDSQLFMKARANMEIEAYSNQVHSLFSLAEIKNSPMKDSEEDNINEATFVYELISQYLEDEMANPAPKGVLGGFKNLFS